MVLTLLWSVGANFAFSQAESFQDEFEIGGIKVEGAQSTDASLIINRSGLTIGDVIQIPSWKTTRTIRNVMQMRLFEDVQVLEDKQIENYIFLIIKVKELASVEQVILKGIVKKKHQKELQALLDDLLPTHTALTDHLRQVAQEKIAHYLEKAGYPNANITVKEQANALHPTRLDVEFAIQLNKKIQAERISFSGNDQVSSHTLRKQMQLTKAGRLFGKSNFVAADFEQDKLAILTYYQSLGYRDVRFGEIKKVQDKEGQLFVHLEIVEGDRYYFGEISFKGNSVYPSDFLAAIFEIKTGDIFDPSRLHERLYFSEDGSDISSLYLDHGYLFFQVDQQEIGLKGNKIDLQINILEGPIATIGKITIAGNDKTSEAVIRRELRTRPGDEFSRSAIIRSQRALANLGYFNPQTLDIKTAIDPKNGTVDLEYVVEEQANDQLEVSAGWQPSTGDNRGGIVGTVGVTFNNFSVKNLLRGEQPFGDGQRISLRAQSNGKPFQSLNFSFSEPWLGGKKPQHLSFGTYFTRYTSDNLTEEGETPHLRILGGKVGLSTRLSKWDDYLVASSELAFENIDLLELSSITLDDGSAITRGNFNNLYFKQSFVRNTTDAPFFPRQGSIFELSGQFTLPYSWLDQSVSDQWLEYHKWRFSSEVFLPLSEKLVLRGAFQAGFLGRYSNSKSRAPFERFDLDGDALSGQSSNITGNDFIYMRGYEREDFPAVANGGAALFNKWTVELRYSLFERGSTSAYGMLFAEAGNAWDDVRNYNPFDLKRTLGMGLRVQVPMFGVLGVDYSWGLDAVTFDKQNWWRSGKLSLILGFDPK